MKNWSIVALISVFLQSVTAAPAGDEGPLKTRTLLSDVFLIDKFYRSMEGPLQVKKFSLDSRHSEIFWVKKIKVEVVDQDGSTPSHQDFFCHFNVDFSVPQRKALMPTATVPSHRMLTMSQGQMEISFPESSALPIHSLEEMTFYFQVLNRLHKGTFYVRHRVTVEYIENKDLKLPMLPLFAHAGMVIQSVAPTVKGWDEAPTNKSCALCRPLAVGDRYPTGMGYIQDGLGQRFASHWKVPPGTQESATPLHSFMPIPYKTTIHAFSTHVHPYAEYLSIVDTRNHKEIVRAGAKTSKEGAVLESIDYLTFPVSEQVVLDETPSYEMVVSYNNPTKEDQDAMAMAVFYLHDRTFKGDKVMSPEIVALHRKDHGPDLIGCSLIPSNVPLKAQMPKLEMKAAAK
jgi:hypothetical protein